MGIPSFHSKSFPRVLVILTAIGILGLSLPEMVTAEPRTRFCDSQAERNLGEAVRFIKDNMSTLKNDTNLHRREPRERRVRRRLDRKFDRLRFLCAKNDTRVIHLPCKRGKLGSHALGIMTTRIRLCVDNIAKQGLSYCDFVGLVAHEFGHAVGIPRNRLNNHQPEKKDRVYQFGWFAEDLCKAKGLDRDLSAPSIKGQWVYSAAGQGDWQKLATSGYELEELLFGDFDGDGKSDPFRADGKTWFYAASSERWAWREMGASSFKVEDLAFGDFDGDGKTDVFRTNGTTWFYAASSERWAWREMGTSSFKVEDLAFGDFDGDGKTDVFRTNGTTWFYATSSERWAWKEINTSGYRLKDVKFGDFDGDGKVDVVREEFGQWWYSSGGKTNWIPLAKLNQELKDLRFGDFDGDGKTDMFAISPPSMDFQSTKKITLYPHANYKGWGRNFTSGMSDLRDIGRHNTTSSIRVHSGIWEMCDEYNVENSDDCLVVSSDIPNLKDIGWNDDISSFRPAHPRSVENVSFMGDFDGDGVVDMFRADGGAWYLASSRQKWNTWETLASSGYELEDLAFGDFDGDGKTDPFRADGTTWFYAASSERWAWKEMGTSTFQAQDLAFGDFDGDGKTDMFRTNGTTWFYAASSKGWTWQEIGASSFQLENLAFGDFDGDGKTDMFRTNGTTWFYAASSKGWTWQEMGESGFQLEDMAFGDFDGDGKTDVFIAVWSNDNNVYEWSYSSGGTRSWISLNTSGQDPSNMQFMDFNRDGKTDVFKNEGRDWSYSSGGSSSWIGL